MAYRLHCVYLKGGQVRSLRYRNSVNLAVADYPTFHSPLIAPIRIVRIAVEVVFKQKPSPYAWPTLSLLHPPIWSIISDGHWTALRRSLMACLKPCTTMSSRNFAFSHLLRALDAELALQRSLSVYRGKAKHEDAFALIRCAAHIDAPTNGTCR